MKRLLSFLALILLLAPALPAQADPSPVLARIVENGTLRVGVSANQPPLNFRNKDGELMGLEVDLARGLAQVMNVKPEFVEKPFGDLLGALDKGEVDLVMSGVTITPERNLKAAFVGPYHLSGKSILTKSTTLAALQDPAQANEMKPKMAALRGSTSAAFVELLMPEAELTQTDTYEEAVALVRDDKVQAMVADWEPVLLANLRHPEAGFAMPQKPLTIEAIGVAVAPGDPLLLNFLENTLGALEVSGLLEALRARWLENPDWVQQLPPR